MCVCVFHADSHAVHTAPAMTHEVMPSAQPMAMPAISHQPPAHQPSPAPSANHQQELQAKILSLFNSGAGSSASASAVSASVPPQPQAYGASLGTQPGSMNPSHASPGMAKMSPSSSPMMGMRPQPRPQGNPPPSSYGAPQGRMMAPQGAPRPAATLSTGTGINFDNPSVQKALDTLIQSGPSINHLVNSGGAPSQAAPRSGMGQGMSPGMGQGMGQGMPMSHYPRHY